MLRARVNRASLSMRLLELSHICLSSIPACRRQMLAVCGDGRCINHSEALVHVMQCDHRAQQSDSSPTDGNACVQYRQVGEGREWRTPVGGCLSSASQIDLRMVILWVAVLAEVLVPSHRSHLETERKPTQDKAMKASSRSLKDDCP